MLQLSLWYNIGLIVIARTAAGGQQQAPGLPFIVNSAYNTLPRLEGRAVVELEVAKADGSAAFVDLQEGTKKVCFIADSFAVKILR